MIQDRIALLVNPSAGRGRVIREKGKLEARLRAKHVAYDTFVTESELHLIEITGDLTHRYRVIVGVGGDTTFNIIANRIIKNKRRNILGIIGLGSVNDVTREIGVQNLERSCDAIKAGRFRSIDMGAVFFPERKIPYYFIGSMSLGLGVIVNKYVDLWMMRHPRISRFRWMGQGVAGVSGIYNAFKAQSIPVCMQLETQSFSRQITSSLVVFSNCTYYAGGFRPSPSGSPYDGKLDCCIISAESFPHFVQSALRIIRKKHKQSKNIEILKDDSFWIRPQCPLEFQVDGEVFRTKGDINLSVLPRSLDVIVHPEHIINGYL